MNKVKVEIKGITPLLQHRFPMEENKEVHSMANNKKKEEPEDE